MQVDYRKVFEERVKELMADFYPEMSFDVNVRERVDMSGVFITIDARKDA